MKDDWVRKTVNEYWSCPVYWVENGRGYRGSSSRLTDPNVKDLGS